MDYLGKPFNAQAQVHEAPVQALQAWKMKAPDLFVKNVRNRPGHDSWLLARSLAVRIEVDVNANTMNI